MTGRKKETLTGPPWRPTLGAVPTPDGVRFRVWAPAADSLSLRLYPAAGGPVEHRLAAEPGGYFCGVVANARPGDRYRFVVPGRGEFPDPASRSQPDGVHGPSAVVDPAAFRWTDAGWPGLRADRLSVYELHVGTFTTDGTFAAAAERLPYLRDLGVTAVELLPLADFPGRWNWGYDGVSLFAPARCYGTPDDLRRLVDAAHAHGLGVIFDVVYNHLGPDGNYVGVYTNQFFTDRHHTPWGSAVNYDGPGSEHVRRFVVENALHWVHEYHADGLRLDATHQLLDDGPRHLLAELADAVRASAPRPVLLFAEDERNDRRLATPTAAGGLGMDGVWADDFHHAVRRKLAGDDEAYYRDYAGTSAEIAGAVRRGWVYTGQPSVVHGHRRGTDPAGLPPAAFVFCVQNHDQVGNRAFGERLNHQCDPAAYRAAAVLLLAAPQTPLLFMGQEWAASAPFRFFTDFHPELGRLVTEGRRREFGGFRLFADPAARDLIPDPQVESTFADSKLGWGEVGRMPHAGVLTLYRKLLAWRRDCSGLLAARAGGPYTVHELGSGGLAVAYAAGDGVEVAAVAFDAGDYELPAAGTAAVVVSTEDADVVADPRPVTFGDDGGRLRFARPGGVVLRAAGGR